MERIKRTVFIEAPPAKVFSYLMDPRNLPEIWPSMVEVSNVKTSPDGATESNDFTYKMAGMKLEGHTRFVDVERDRRIVWKSEGGIKSTIRWTFTPHGFGTDIVDEVEYELPANLLTRLAAPFVRRINEHEADACVQNLKVRMETPEVGR
ncbi:MAG TPA: SRPBCC family protein [Anaeromyxobacteraceae bacterium]|nr:SRPBCC family protein [Anaeromyxobacteraceae bacterium]